MSYSRSSLIYEFYKSHIQFGYYRKGEFIPSIEQLCAFYQVAPLTVRNALLRLQEEGFVSLSPGRKTIVTYDPANNHSEKNVLEYFRCRAGAFREMYQAGELLLNPLMEEGCRRLNMRERQEIREDLLQYEEGDFRAVFTCCHVMIRTLKNRLASDLLDEIVAFYQFPFIFSQRGPMAHLARRFVPLAKEAAETCLRGDTEGLYQVFSRVFRFFGAMVEEYISQAVAEQPEEEQILFEWNVYRERPQLCYSLAARLMGRIFFTKEYGPGNFLPSYGAMAEEFSVSFSTIRRVVDLLERLGVVTSIHGVGTQVIPLALDEEKLRHPAVQKNIAMFRQGLQICSLCLDNFVERFYPALSRDGIAACTSVLRAQQKEGAGFMAIFTCMGYLVSDSTNRSLREICEKLYEVLLLGLPILEYQAAGRFAGEKLRACPERLIYSLEKGDMNLFRESVRELLVLAGDATGGIV